jgi:hypothetical protein
MPLPIVLGVFGIGVLLALGVAVASRVVSRLRRRDRPGDGNFVFSFTKSVHRSAKRGSDQR